MNALIIGATGLVGQALLERIEFDERYEKVFVLGRNAPKYKSPKVEFVKSNLDDFAKAQCVHECEHIYCALGTTIKNAGSKEAFRHVDLETPLKVAQEALRPQGSLQSSGTARLKKFLVVTALGSDAKSKIFYNQVKGELEESLMSLGIEELHIFRPSLLIGPRHESRPGEALAQKASRFTNWMLRGPLQKYRAIDARIVAHSMAKAALSASEKGTHIHESDAIENSAHELTH